MRRAEVRQGMMAQAALLRRGLWLEYATLGWNVVGAVVVLGAAFVARSVALAGFGLDSLIEIFASVIVVWQLRNIGHDRERTALKLIGGAFFVLALYLLIQAGFTLFTQSHPHHSPLGIAWLAATAAAMFLLARGKLVTGKALGNAVLLTEARVTVIDGILAASVLVGLVLNALLGWWWADPAASLVIVYYGIREGLHAWHGEE